MKLSKQYLLYSSSRVISLVNSTLAAKVLTPEQLGASAIIQSIATQVSTTVDLGLNDYASRNKFLDSINELFYNILVFRLLTTISILIPILLLVTYTNDTINGWWSFIIAIFLLKNATDTLFYYRTIDEMRTYYVFAFLPPLFTAIIYFFTLEGTTIQAYDLLVITSTVLVSNLALVMRMIYQTGVYKFNVRFLFHYLRLNWLLVISTAMNTYTSAGIIIVAAYFLSQDDLGIIRTSLILIVPLELFSSVLHSWLYPRVVTWAKDVNFYQNVKLVYKYYYLLLFVFLGYIILVPDVLFFLGSNFRANEDFIILAVLAKLVAIMFLPYHIAIYTDKSNIFPFFASTWNLLITLSIGGYFIWKYNLVGVGFSLVYLEIFYGGLCVYFTYKLKLSTNVN